MSMIQAEIKGISKLEATLKPDGNVIKFQCVIPDLEVFRKLVRLQDEQSVNVLFSCNQLELTLTDKPQGVMEFGQQEAPENVETDQTRHDEQPEAVTFKEDTGDDQIIMVDPDTYTAITKSYSADILMDGKIKKPVAVGIDAADEYLVICTSIQGGYAEAYRVVPDIGAPVFYDDITDYDARHADPLGYWNGIAAKNRKTYCLVGPPIKFVDVSQADITLTDGTSSEPDDLFGDCQTETQTEKTTIEATKERIEENAQKSTLYPDPTTVVCLGDPAKQQGCGHEKAFVSWQEPCPTCGVANWCDAGAMTV